jgi:hypothetical protein
MTTPADDPSRPAMPTELPASVRVHLRAAARWARFIAVGGILLVALFGSLAGLLIAHEGLRAVEDATLVPYAVALGSTALGSFQMWRYGRNLGSFLRRADEPALTRAFRRMRHFLAVWTLYLVLSTAIAVLAVLRQL